MNLTLHFSQLNSFVSDILNWVGNFFQNSFSVIGYSLLQLFYRLIICSLFAILDAVQLLFRKLAGLDTYYVNGEATNGDIVLSLFNNQTVQNVFWSLVILAVVLLIIVTIVSLIKQETLATGDKDRKSKSKIFSSALRALLNFFMVPVVAILGIFMGNALLKSLDGATNQGEITRASVMIFRACSQDANRARLSETFRDDLYGTNGKDGINNMGVISASTKEGIANAIDMAFEQSASFTPKKFDFDNLDGLGNIFSTSDECYYKYVLSISNDNDLSSFSIYNPDQVFYYYDLSHFNYILALIALIIIVWILLEAAIGLIKRMFEIVILLCISPVVCSVMPLDENPIKEWKKMFIQNVLLAYSVVVSLNLMMMLFGPLKTITLFGANDGSVLSTIGGLGLNSFLQLLITCAGFMFFKNFSKDLAALIGIKEDLFNQTKDQMQRVTKGIGTGVGIAAGLIGGAANKAMGMTQKLNPKYIEAKDEMKKAQKESKADPNNEIKKQNLANATKKFEDVKTEKVSKYDEQAKARLKQAKSNIVGFASNGLAKPFKDGLGGKGIDVSPKAIKTGVTNIAKTTGNAFSGINHMRSNRVNNAINKKAERKLEKTNKKIAELSAKNTLNNQADLSGTESSTKKMNPHSNKTVIAPSYTQPEENVEKSSTFKPTRQPGVRYTRSKNTYMRAIEKDTKPIEKALKSKEGIAYIKGSTQNKK